MKLLPNKTFPHPVLWGNADDYVRRQFQAVRNFTVGEAGVPVLSFSFTLNEERIVGLLSDQLATYLLEVYCPITLVRRIFCTREKAGEFVLGKGDLYGRVEVNAFVVCTRDIQEYYSSNFNEEFGNASFDLLQGDVLAAAESLTWHWDTECVAPLHSVFDLVASDNIQPGMFAVDTSEDKVKIKMCPHDKDKFEQMRHSSEQKPVAMFVYFSAVAEVLRQMKDDDSDGGDTKRWYRAIEYKLGDLGKIPFTSSSDPFMLAQELLRGPFGLVLPSFDSGA